MPKKYLSAIFLFIFAYFHQGGGWNQNARFALVRAIVEEGTFSIDSYLVYGGQKSRDGSIKLARLPVRNGEVTINGRSYSLAWTTPDKQLIPVTGLYTPKEALLSVEQVSATGDVAFSNDHFYPNKAPGTSFLAVPAYFILFQLEKLFGLDPDDWWILTCNFWLTTVLSVGIISAAGCVLFYCCILAFWAKQQLPAILACITLAIGTLFFPNATILYEHNSVAVLLLSSFYLLYKTKLIRELAGDNSIDKTVHKNKRIFLYIFLSGVCAGYAAITSYIAAVVVVMLAIYLVMGRGKRFLWLFGLGLLGPFMLICLYNTACFGTPLTTNYTYENPLFQKQGTFAQLFTTPQWHVLLLILFSPFRGLFYYSPVLLLSIPGFIYLVRSKQTRREAWLFISIVFLFVLFNISFNAWHGGWCIGPRYLVPAIPFLMIFAVFGFIRFFRASCVLAILSIAINLICTAVDPQPPVGNSIIARVPGQSLWQANPISQYEVPLFFSEQAFPILHAQLDAKVADYENILVERGLSELDRKRQLTSIRQQWDTAITRGEAQEFVLSTIRGPVSANPIGCYEGWYYRVYKPHSIQAQWNSFNLGEFLFPHSRLSLIPLLLIWCCITAIIIRAEKN